MKHEVVHICSFSSTDELRGRTLTYENVRAVVLKAGRFSVFEATQTARHAGIFDRLRKDPTLEILGDKDGYAYPWTGVRLREAHRVGEFTKPE